MTINERMVPRAPDGGGATAGGVPERRAGLLRRIIDWLYYLITPRIEESVLIADQPAGSPMRAADGASDESPPPATVAVDHAAVDRILSSIQTRGIQPTAGKIQMVHLGDAKERLGDRWRSLSARAMALSEMVLTDRLDPTDVFTRYEDHAFIVVFGKLDEREAAWHADAIGREICLLLMQDAEFENAIGAETVTARVDKLLPNANKASVADLSHALDDETEARKIAADLGADAVQSEPLSTTYRPMLFLPNQMIGLFFGVPRRRLPRGDWVIGEAAYPRHGSDELVLAMDLLLARRSVQYVARSVAAEHGSIIGTMANLQSLARSARMHGTFEALSTIEREHMVLEIAGIAPTLPVSRIVEVAGRYRSLVKALNLRVSLLEPDVARYASVGLNSIGCDLNFPALRRLDSDAIEEAVAKFVRGANAGGMQTHFYGVDTEEHFTATVAAGASYLSGQAVADFVDTPSRPYRFDEGSASQG